MYTCYIYIYAIYSYINIFRQNIYIDMWYDVYTMYVYIYIYTRYLRYIHILFTRYWRCIYIYIVQCTYIYIHIIYTILTIYIYTQISYVYKYIYAIYTHIYSYIYIYIIYIYNIHVDITMMIKYVRCLDDQDIHLIYFAFSDPHGDPLWDDNPHFFWFMSMGCFFLHQTW